MSRNLTPPKSSSTAILAKSSALGKPPTALDKIRELHTSLWLGRTGRNIVAATTFLSIFLIVTGIYLWWPVRNTGTSRGLSFYLHYALGIYFSLFLLVLAATGLVLTFDGTIGPWVFKITQSIPPQYQASSNVVPGKFRSLPARLSRLPPPDGRCISRLHFDSPQIPQDPTPSPLNFPGTPRENRVLIDQYSGTILSVLDSCTPPAGVKIMSDNGAIHTGSILGLPTQILMSLSSLVLAVQTITGYCLWWKKLHRNSKIVA